MTDGSDALLQEPESTASSSSRTRFHLLTVQTCMAKSTVWRGSPTTEALTTGVTVRTETNRKCCHRGRLLHAADEGHDSSGACTSPYIGPASRG